MTWSYSELHIYQNISYDRIFTAVIRSLLVHGYLVTCTMELNVFTEEKNTLLI